MNVEVLPTAALGPRGAELILDGVERAEISVLGVATGSSPSPIYAALASHDSHRLALAAIFALDEYVGLPEGHPQSYSCVVGREVTAPLGVESSRVRVLDGSAADLDRECAEFEDAIRAAGGVDLQILGIGRNGHIGFNEPGTHHESRTHLAPLAESTRRDNARFFGSVAEVPAYCLTQGIGTILEARRILVVATGSAKAVAVRRALEDPPAVDSPASWLQHHPHVTFLLDAEAASMLTI